MADTDSDDTSVSRLTTPRATTVEAILRPFGFPAVGTTCSPTGSARTPGSEVCSGTGPGPMPGSGYRSGSVARRRTGSPQISCSGRGGGAGWAGAPRRVTYTLRRPASGSQLAPAVTLVGEGPTTRASQRLGQP